MRANGFSQRLKPQAFVPCRKLRSFRDGAWPFPSGQACRVIIAAHGNGLRAPVKYLDSIFDDDIVKLNTPTGVPFVCELDVDIKPIKHGFLGDPNEIRKAQEAVAQRAQRRSP
jgi:hypothetical protein